MIKYILHNITYMCEDIQYFYTKKSLNNYIVLYVDPPYWVENLYTNKKIYVGFDGQSYVSPSDEIKDYIETVSHNKLDTENVSCETLRESEIDWIKRHTPVKEEKEPYTILEKIYYFLIIISLIIMAIFLLYLFLSSVSFIAEYFSKFTWKVFNIL